MTMTEVRDKIVELREVADSTPDAPPAAASQPPCGGPDPLAVVQSLHASMTALGERLTAVERRETPPPAPPPAPPAPAETPPPPASVDLTPVTTAQAALAARLDGLERRMNRQGVRSPEAPVRRTFAERREFDAAFRTGNAEMREIDVSLLPLQVLMVSPLTGRYVMLALCLKSLEAARVRIGFYTAAVAGIRGIDTATQGTWIPVKIDPLEFVYNPLLNFRDVQLIGSALLDTEGLVAIDAFSARLNKLLFAAIRAAMLAPSASGFDPYKNPARLAPGTTGAIGVADVDMMIGAMDARYRPEAVFFGSKATTVKLMGLIDPITRAPLWVPSLAAGVPATLRGYPYHEDEEATDSHLAFVNPGRGVAVNESSTAALVHLAREGSDYRPHWSWLANGAVLDPRAIVVLDITLTGTIPLPPP